MRILFLPLIFAFALGPTAHAQQAASPTGDADKRKTFLRAREEIRPIAPPPQTTVSTPKPKPTVSTSSEEARPKAGAKSEQKSEPKSEPDSTPRPKPKPKPHATPLLVITPKPAVTPPPSAPRSITAPVTVQKSGFEEAEIIPPEKPTRGGWWFSAPVSYRFLTAAVRAEIDRAPVRKGRWRYTVVHNSGTRQGSAKAFEYYHLRVRKMPNGLAYHFVVGNGTSTGDGQIEIGNRWRRQINGGHVHSDYLNNIAIGICLVGDFNRDVPTERQKAATEELINYLRRRVGKVDGRQSIVKPHRAINPPRWPTDCPGDRFPYGWLRSKYPES